MAKSRATLGYLATLEIARYNYSDSPPSLGSYLKLLEVKSIAPSDFTVPVVIVTHLESPNATEEKTPGLIMPGTLDVSGNFIGDESQLLLPELAQGREVVSYRLTAKVDKGTKTYTQTADGFVGDFAGGPFEPSKTSEFKMKMEVAGNITYEVV